ncbi:MAG: type II secretion system F family protein [Verrucomicrobia bacterium]|nr:MAG: type II secretion system F family protein [Verrucomicrobiota bacterium]
MPQFNYKARRRTGELVDGILEVADQSAAVLQLQRAGLFPVSVIAAKVDRKAARAAGETPAAATGAGRVLPESLRKLFKTQRKPKLQELATYTQQLANLLKAGMPLTMALHSMASLTSKGIPGTVSHQLKQDVIEGRSLSDALARQAHVFPELVINMVRAGEQSGALEEVLRRLASHFERFSEVQSKFKSAMIYPMFVCFFGLLLIIFFTAVMLPKFTEFFQTMNLKDGLPLATQIVIAISDFMKTYGWWLIPLVAMALYFVVNRYRATPDGRRRTDAMLMKLPVFGSVIRLNLFGQFSRILSTLLANGVPVLQALRITEQVISNTVIKDALAATREAVTDGKTLAQPLAKAGVFPQLMIDLIRIGEETGDVPGSLLNVAETYEADLNVALRTMMGLIEPTLIVGLAVVIGGLLVGVMQAMFAITQSIQMR